MNGILPIYKEAGMTSHDVVARLRRILQTKKIGHSGTLDPDATGVLLVLVGRACKILPYLEDTDKAYTATLKLGERTFSDDWTGEVLERKAITPIEDFPALLASFVGKQKQLPPMVSSVKINGRKLYEYARANEPVERTPRDVELYELTCLDEATLRFHVACSSGTYIRSLCCDLASRSNNLGCMGSLLRTNVGRFSLDDCATLAQVEAGTYTLLPIEQALAHMKMMSYEPIEDIKNGKHVRLDCDGDEVVIMEQAEALAIYKRHHDNVFKCARGLW